MRGIFGCEPDFIATENGVLHRIHVMRGEKQLRSMLVDGWILEHRDDVAQELRVQFCIELVDDDHAALGEREQEHRENGNQFLRACRFLVEGKLV